VESWIGFIVRITTNRNGYARRALIDLHSHILPGLDDGAADLETSLEMARTAVADGIRTTAVTPHVRDDYPTSAAEMEGTLATLRTAVAAEGIELELLPGGELDLGRLAQLDAHELRRFSLGGNGSWLLLEFPYAGWPIGLLPVARRLAEEGFRVVLAHPERHQEVQARPVRLQEFVESGIVVQLTAASVEGRLGRRPQQAAHALLELGLAHLLASDAHAPSLRAGGLSAAVDAVGDPALARWLTEDVPAAIVSGSAVPQRP
jgi:protein-tyrosine phosphatase